MGSAGGMATPEAAAEAVVDAYALACAAGGGLVGSTRRKQLVGPVQELLDEGVHPRRVMVALGHWHEEARGWRAPGLGSAQQLADEFVGRADQFGDIDGSISTPDGLFAEGVRRAELERWDRAKTLQGPSKREVRDHENVERIARWSAKREVETAAEPTAAAEVDPVETILAAYRYSSYKTSAPVRVAEVARMRPYICECIDAGAHPRMIFVGLGLWRAAERNAEPSRIPAFVTEAAQAGPVPDGMTRTDDLIAEGARRAAGRLAALALGGGAR